MERLTKKGGFGGSEYIRCNSYFDCLKKLSQLEDIEERLGIDLVTFFKAMEYGIYAKYESEKPIKCSLNYNPNISYFGYSLYYPDENEDVEWYRAGDLFFIDYGKTWALTKEELEK